MQKMVSLPICREQHIHKEIIEHAKHQIPTEEQLFQLSELFKLFGDSTRIKIISALIADELCVCDLSNMLIVSQSAISHQLRLLRGCQMVKARRDGKSVFYSIANQEMAQLLQIALKLI
ncbi:MAG: metalloregulator ArsR/SmtB family transcription factor [Oscillospiraceae bacterium]